MPWPVPGLGPVPGLAARAGCSGQAGSGVSEPGAPALRSGYNNADALLLRPGRREQQRCL